MPRIILGLGLGFGLRFELILDFTAFVGAKSLFYLFTPYRNHNDIILTLLYILLLINILIFLYYRFS